MFLYHKNAQCLYLNGTIALQMIAADSKN